MARLLSYGDPRFPVSVGPFQEEAEWRSIEGRFRDASSGEVVVTFADKEMAKFYPLNVRDFTYPGHPESIVDAWAGQLVAVAGRSGNEPVKDQGRIGLRPW
jgi:hypothetical protein